MTNIIFKHLPAYDKIIAYTLGIDENAKKIDTYRKIVDEFERKWKIKEKQILEEIEKLSGKLPKTIRCYISLTSPRKGLTNPLTIHLEEDIEKMFLSLIYHLNKIALGKRKDIMDRIYLTAIACNINQDIILDILSLYNTIKIYKNKNILPWIRGFMLEETRKDRIIYEKIKKILKERGLKHDTESILDLIAKNCIKNIE